MSTFCPRCETGVGKHITRCETAPILFASRAELTDVTEAPAVTGKITTEFRYGSGPEVVVRLDGTSTVDDIITVLTDALRAAVMTPDPRQRTLEFER